MTDNNKNNCPLIQLKYSMIKANKDWSMNSHDAWQYGIVVGWPDYALKQLKKTFKWTKDQVSHLQLLNKQFQSMTKG